MAAHNIPVLSVAVALRGNIIWADIAARHPVTSETHFRIGTASPPPPSDLSINKSPPPPTPTTPAKSLYSAIVVNTPTDLLRFQLSHPIPTLQRQLISQRVLELLTLSNPGIQVAILTNATLPETANLSQKIATAFQN